MGLESHVDRELQRAKTGLVRGEDYWFYDGLRTDSITSALLIKKTLDESGEFGPSRIIDWDEDKADMGGFTIEFGMFRSFFNGSDKEYEKYCDEFANGGVE